MAGKAPGFVPAAVQITAVFVMTSVMITHTVCVDAIGRVRMLLVFVLDAVKRRLTLRVRTRLGGSGRCCPRNAWSCLFLVLDTVKRRLTLRVRTRRGGSGRCCCPSNAWSCLFLVLHTVKGRLTLLVRTRLGGSGRCSCPGNVWSCFGVPPGCGAPKCDGPKGSPAPPCTLGVRPSSRST